MNLTAKITLLDLNKKLSSRVWIFSPPNPHLDIDVKAKVLVFIQGCGVGVVELKLFWSESPKKHPTPFRQKIGCKGEIYSSLEWELDTQEIE